MTASTPFRSVPPTADVPFETPDPKPEAHLLAEAAVLGAAILSTEARAGMCATLDGDDFEREAHRTMFCTLAELHDDDVPVDQVTVNDRLATTDRLDEVGGPVAVFDLTEPLTCPHPGAWSHYAAIVAREGRRRRLVRALRRALVRLEAGATVDVVLATIAEVTS